MINDELKTALRWYDDIEKQGRYKSYCAAVCDYKRLSPLNTIPPFQIKTNTTNATITSWATYCAEGNILDTNLTAQIASKLFTLPVNGQDNIIYKGSAISGLSLPCGSYYMKIETSEGDFYSEIFYCEDFTNPTFSQMEFPLFTAWRWYGNQQKQNRYKNYCLANCEFYLLCGDDALLPFQFRKPHTASNIINSWVLRNLDEDCEHNLDKAPLIIEEIGSYDYVFYLSDDIDNLPCGVWQSIITINGIAYYSEIIKIIDTIDTNTDTNYLLTEKGKKLLQETSFGILLE